MSHLPKVAWISILAAAAVSSSPPQAAAQSAQVQRLNLLKSGAGTQIEIQTSRRVIPLTQVLTDPDRLVIDFSDAVASPQIHTINVNNGVVKQVRVGRVTDNPPITRVVIDLNSAQPFQLLPSGKSVIVKIGDGGNVAPAIEVARAAPPSKSEPTAAPVTVSEEPAAAQLAPNNVPTPKLSPARQPASELTVSAVPVASRSVPATSMRTAALNSSPAPTVTITRVPVSPSGHGEVRHVAVLKASGATEIEIETNERLTPEVQTVTGPDRLVIDFPQALPGPQLRALAVNQGEVKGVRVGLLSARPPVTRIVLDLKSPQAYQLFPSTRSVIVKLGDSANSGITVTPAPPAEPAAPAAPAAAEPATPPPPPKKVDVAFQNGKLSLTSDKASLAEVLTELRNQTGADIVVPSGAEREEVAVSLGPASPREVISQLLNGSRYNFIIMGADDDANKVTRLILTPKTGGGVIPQNVPDENEAAMPDPAPVGQVQTARSSGPAPAVPPAIEEAQPQGDSNPPPDTTPQPGDPQAAPN